MEIISIKPRVAPRDALDLAIMLMVSPVQLFMLFGMPFLLAYIVSRSILISFVVVVGVYILFALFSVWSLGLSADGIQFRRVFGTPKILRWDDLKDVRLARRGEVIWSGWLWPIFPAREMTACLSARDHVRFEGPFGYCFFPPADAQAFLQLVAKYRP